MGLREWLGGRVATEQSVLKRALDAADRERADGVAEEETEEQERTRKIQEQMVLSEEAMRSGRHMTELSPLVNRAMREVATRTWGKDGYKEDFPPNQFTMENRGPNALLISWSWGVGKRLPGSPASAECFRFTLHFNRAGDVAAWNVEGQPRREPPLTIEALAADLAVAYRQGPTRIPLWE